MVHTVTARLGKVHPAHIGLGTYYVLDYRTVPILISVRMVNFVTAPIFVLHNQSNKYSIRISPAAAG